MDQPPPADTPTNDRRHLADIARQWLADGRPALAVRAVGTSELGPPTGDELTLIAGAGELVGTLLRGVIDSELDELARRRATEPTSGATISSLVVPTEAATAAGLTCGGTVDVVVQALADIPAALWDDLASGQPTALISPLDEAGGTGMVVRGPGQRIGSLGDPNLDAAAEAEGVRLLGLAGGASTRIAPAGRTLLCEVWNPVPRLVIVGTAAVGQSLTDMAQLLGWQASTISGVAEAEALVGQLGRHDMVVVIEHDPAIATPALATALRRHVGYVGALGSRRTQAARRNALEAAGTTGDELDQMHGPTGLDLGARTPMETAVSIVAEIIAVRSGRSAHPLDRTDTAISR